MTQDSTPNEFQLQRLVITWKLLTTNRTTGMAFNESDLKVLSMNYLSQNIMFLPQSSKHDWRVPDTLILLRAYDFVSMASNFI
jgi:hypothetical protein